MYSRFSRNRQGRKRIENKNKKNGGRYHFYRFDRVAFSAAVAAERRGDGKCGDNAEVCGKF